MTRVQNLKTIAATLAFLALAATGCDVAESAVKDEPRSSGVTRGAAAGAGATVEPESEPEPTFTTAQENAIRSAESYLDMTGFSKRGLIDQLASEYGNGYARADARFAVNHIDVDWKAEAVEAAESYLEMTGFSRQGLIDQLTSEYGAKFTPAQAEYAVGQVGL